MATKSKVCSSTRPIFAKSANKNIATSVFHVEHRPFLLGCKSWQRFCHQGYADRSHSELLRFRRMESHPRLYPSHTGNLTIVARRLLTASDRQCSIWSGPVSYTHLRAHETRHD